LTRTSLMELSALSVAELKGPTSKRRKRERKKRSPKRKYYRPTPLV